MIFKIRLIICFLFLMFNLIAQEDKFENTNHIYSKNIRTVKFHLSGLPLSTPMINLGSNTTLNLSFDDIDADAKNYVYTIQLCNADWSTNESLTTFEYLKGFDEDEIDNYRFSQNTLTSFTNYKLSIPNNNMSWIKSGNYILKVYEDEDERRLVLSRRFMVAEPLMTIDSKMNLPVVVSNQRTHQEIDFVVYHKGIPVRSPQSEIKASILQNGRWDNALTGMTPLFVKENEMSFDYQNKIVFPASKEWRMADVRSYETYLRGIKNIKRVDEGHDVFLTVDQKRGYDPYFFFADVNGKFLVENYDRTFLNGRRFPSLADTLIFSGDEYTDQERAQEKSRILQQQVMHREELDREQELQDVVSDYALVYFNLEVTAEVYGADVYIFGELSDWEIKDEFKMKYNSKTRMYENEIFLKQGFYNYQYACIHENKPDEIDLEELEGNWFETENDYLVLVYYRPFGKRYDRLIGVRTFSSSR